MAFSVVFVSFTVDLRHLTLRYLLLQIDIVATFSVVTFIGRFATSIVNCDIYR